MARVASGVVLAAAFFAVVWYGNATVLVLVALAVGGLAFHEYSTLMRRIGGSVPRVASLLVTLAAIAAVPFPFAPPESVAAVGVVIVAAAGIVQFAREKAGAAVAGAPPSAFAHAALGIAAGGFAAMYIGLALGTLVGVYVIGGRGAVVVLVATIAVSDTAQYYSGRLMGRRPLAPRLSPKKTIEGAVGGFVVAPLFLYVAGPYFVPPAVPVGMAAMGVVLVTCGIAGDLFESMIKRAAEAKDSSALIPGHGGVLDRIDALLFAAPVFYVYLRWVYSV